MFVLEWVTRRLAARTPHLVTDAIHHDLPEETLKGSFMPRLERLERDDRATQDFLSEVVGIQQTTGVPRQAPVCPTPDPGQIPCKQRFTGLFVATFCAKQERKRSFSGAMVWDILARADGRRFSRVTHVYRDRQGENRADYKP
jgi:hypothetical protein